MAAPTNTVNVLNESVKESLSLIISNVQPMDTPIMSGIKRERAMSFKEEWQVDDFNTPNTTARAYGDDYSFATRKNPARRQNFIQSLHDSFVISDEEEAIKHAGFTSRLAFEMMKLGKEQRVAVELILAKLNQASDPPTAANNTVGTTASIMAFLETNTSGGVGAADGGWNSTTKEYDARTDGSSTRAFSEAQLKTILDGLWENSGDTSDVVIFTNNTQKNAFNNFDGLAAQRIQNSGMKQAAIVGAADSYRSNYGTHRIMLDRHMRTRDVFFLRTGRMKLRTLWMFRPRRLAVTGNNQKFGLSSSFTLCVKNEKEHGMIADLT